MAGKGDKTRLRSPSYPYINLEKAIDLARRFYDKENKHKTSPNVAIEHMGYKASNSEGFRALAAVTSFGLLDASGSGTERQVWISDLGRTILLDRRERSTEKDEAIREAALRPSIYRLLWEQWGSSFPSESTMETILLRDHNFNKVAVGQFIRNMKETFEFVRLFDKDRKDDEPVEIEEDGESKAEDASIIYNPRKPADNPIVEIRDITLPLIGGGMAVLRIPVPLSEENFDFLTSLLGSMKKALIEKKTDEKFLSENL